MKIFISWSGEESKQVALLLKGWLKKILQATDPWMSDVDIQPGTRWSQSIAGELQTSGFGIICVTPSNESAEWINFEAGALSIAIQDGTERKVVPLLIGFDNRGAIQRGPLGLFNALRFVKEDVWKLLLTLNAELPNALDGDDLGDLFETYWPKLAAQVEELKKLEKTPSPAPISQEEMIKEIYSSVLNLQHLLPKALLDPIFTSSQYEAAAKRDALIRMVGQLEVDKYSGTVNSPFTPREIKVATMAREGLSNERIAEELGVSPRTVEGHLYKIFSKTGVTRRSDIPNLTVKDEP
ncbi:LuxR C-terminal-related transcriptional regulator [Arthrobacter sp. 4R501]|uniref:LuxR C-terminal-related transcriptional regulator n=1 Tax=Arthrobacter sp. 4R501 TaxID=2058886 RepID=UPI000CE487FC|nr:LuxR C-terminal-related transcriptional regulator [Arthrobacter sp. 4R501]